MHLILWPDDHRKNVSRQGIECTTHGIRRERQKVVVKSIRRTVTENILASFEFLYAHENIWIQTLILEEAQVSS